MNIALVNQFYPPSRAPTGLLLSDLAETLCHRGHRVSVITSPGLYLDAGHDMGSDMPEGISVFRVGPGGRHRTGPVGKMAEYARFLPEAYRAIRRLNPRPDALVCMTTPPFCGLIASRLCRKWGVPYLLWCMDLYPEALVANGWAGSRSLPYRMLSCATRRERNDATAIIALGADMAERIRSSVSNVPVLEIPVWSRLKVDNDALDGARTLRCERGWGDDETVLLYSGHMGRAHSVEGFVRLATRIKKNGKEKVRFVFCGGGASAASWRREGGLLFEWIEPVGASDLAPHLLSADIHLISQQCAWAGVVVPSKFQAACALGRPVLFTGPRESIVAQWLDRAQSGWIVPPGDEAAMRRAEREVGDRRLAAEKGARASMLSEQLFHPERTCVQVAQLVEKAGAEGEREKVNR